MSEKYNKVDEEYKDGLIDLEFEVDVEEMWADLEPKLEKKKDRKPFFFWLFAVIVGLTSILFIFSNDHKTDKTSESTSIAIKTANDTSNLEDKNVQLSINNTATSSKDNLIINKSTKNTNKAIVDIKSNNIKSLYSNRSQFSTSKSTLETLNERNESFRDLQVFLETDSKSKYEVSEHARITENNPDINPSVYPEVQNSKNEDLESKINEMTQRVLTISKLACPITPLRYVLDEINTPIFAKNENPKQLNLAFSSSMYYGLSTSKKSNISRLPSFDLGLTIGYDISKSIRINSGIEYLRINEKFNFEETQNIKEKTFVTDALYKETNGIVEYFSDSVYIVRTILKKRQTQNSYTLWNIPIGLSVSSGHGDWKFSMGASAIINLSSSFRGFILNDTEDDIISITGAHPKFDTRVGIGFRISPSISCSINEYIDLELALSFRSSPFSDNNSSQSWNALGINTGVNFKF